MRYRPEALSLPIYRPTVGLFGHGGWHSTWHLRWHTREHRHLRLLRLPALCLAFGLALVMLMGIHPGARAEASTPREETCIQHINLLVMSFPLERRTCSRIATANTLFALGKARAATRLLCSGTEATWRMARAGAPCIGTVPQTRRAHTTRIRVIQDLLRERKQRAKRQ
jgi:hypothetical protein